ncbi:MAG: PQQ-binding-like beta-propeller repeat protein [Planctomycetes bacterium]|nr:PQQ-binding-like beta-propeller repeat protein [Planctomycetota bacterium]
MRCCQFISLATLFILPVTSAGQAVPKSSLPDAFSPDQLIWERRLGTHQYSFPSVRNGYVYIGVDDRGLDHPVVRPTGGGLAMCLKEATGDLVWQLAVPRYMAGVVAPFHFNHWKCGTSSTPAFDEKYLYIVGSRGDVLCLDQLGQANGNDGPFQSEAQYMGIPKGANYTLTARDGDIIWAYNLIKALGVVPHDVCGSSPLLHGNHLYVCTSNGQDDKHRTIANPEAPSLIVLHKDTGKLLATDGGLFGERLYHGNWSSPALATFKGRDTILFSGGDGIMYAFEPIAAESSTDSVQDLRIIWQYDCNPADYRTRDGVPIPYSQWNRKRTDGPSELIASPAVYKNRVYVAIGQSPVHGKGRGVLSCIDGVSGQKIWENRGVDRTLATVEIHDGLCYVPDVTGRLHCIDAETGESVWTYDLNDLAWSCSAKVIGDKVYVGTVNKRWFYVFKAGRETKLLHRSKLSGAAITPTVQNGVLYLATQRNLFALRPSH